MHCAPKLFPLIKSIIINISISINVERKTAQANNCIFRKERLNAELNEPMDVQMKECQSIKQLKAKFG